MFFKDELLRPDLIQDAQLPRKTPQAEVDR